MIIKRLAPWFLLSSFSILLALHSFSQEKILTAGMKINRSMKIKKATYKLQPSLKDSNAVITIEGNNLVIDFNNAVLTGKQPVGQPDKFYGICILVKNGKDITIKNLKARGYKVAIMATNVQRLTIQDCDFSFNYRQQLHSTQEKENMSDWLSYHNNEADEWLRYGAAIYLKNCDFAVIKNCKVTGGQNALMMSNSNDGMIYNNDFSFNSGVGIGLYRSNRNQVMYNRVIFNVRGYSHGVYNRGQDSAGMLVYEQSSNNVFYKNNVTHSGDGFFLWAGQTTINTGKGGCNDNLIVGNDFSYAPTNGIEVTFSRNLIIDNRIFECDYGIWGGYSYQSVIRDNNFRNNRIAIAIEHGHENKISYNLFSKDSEAIRLWAEERQSAGPMDTGSGFARNRDIKSRDYEIVSNSFNGNKTVFNISRTDSLHIMGNTMSGIGVEYKIDSTVTNMDTTIHDDIMEKASEDPLFTITDVEQPADPFKGSGQWAGKRNIRITQWGPYDFRSPLIWLTNPTDTSAKMNFELIGPKGTWRIKTARGVSDLSARSGVFPATITALKVPGEKSDILIELVYTGDAMVTPFGQAVGKGKPYTFTFQKFFQPINFHVRWYAVDTNFHNPVTRGELFPPNARVRPLKTAEVNKLDYAWWGGMKSDSIHRQFITVAEGKANVEKGEYQLGITWNDAVRLYVDGKLVIDEWYPGRYQFDESLHREIKLSLGGNHTFLVEHLELGGFAVLSMDLKKVSL